MNKVIAISLSPNAFASDVWLAFKTLITPWNYYGKQSVEKLTKWFADFFATKYVFGYTSGRAGLYEILKGYDIGKGDEVILQAFTCVALPNAILAVGATPVYVDILKNTTMDPKEIEKKITKKTKAIIMQHTFGIPSRVEDILSIAKKHDLKVIEDCAHGIGIGYKGKKLGQFGDSAFFSFGRDKAFSAVFGGMVVTNNETLAKKLETQYQKLAYPSVFWIMQQLFHPIAFTIITPLYDVSILGKSLVVLLQKLRFLSFPVTPSEKKGKYAISDTQKIPAALAVLALSQLHRLEQFNATRTRIANEYMKAFSQLKEQFISQDSLPYLRFSFLTKDRDALALQMRKHHIYLGKWYTSPIDPKGTDFATIGYSDGSCPVAEKTAQEIINLPTFPTMTADDVTRVIKTLKNYV